MEGKRNYYEDVRLFESGVVLIWSFAFLVFMFSLPIYIPSYYIFLLDLAIVYVIIATGLNILVGYTGLISLGHNAFFAIGAYGTAILMIKYQVPFILAISVSAFLAAFLGFLLGLPALRLEGPYLAIATLGFSMTLAHFINNTKYFGDRAGIMAPPLDIGVPQLGFTWVLDTDISKYYLILVIAIVLVLGARNLVKTRIGRAFMAIRDSDIAAEAIGINLTIYKTLSFSISGFYAGIAGGLFCFVLGQFGRDLFNPMLSVLFLVMVVVGGLGSIAGPIMGALLITYLQYDLLKNIPEMPYVGDFLVFISRKWFMVRGLENFSLIILGLIMIGIMMFEPLGMYGVWLRIKRYWKTWPF